MRAALTTPFENTTFPTNPPPPLPLQVYLGDFVEVSDESSRSGFSMGQVVELYQDAAVSLTAHGLTCCCNNGLACCAVVAACQ